MAESYGLDLSVALHVAGEHGHGIGVVQEPGIGTNRLHVLCKVPQYGDGSQGAHDAADAHGVTDGLAQAVFLRHLKVDDGTRIVQSHLNGIDHEVGSTQGLSAVLHAQIGLDDSTSFIGIFVDCTEDDLRLLKALGIDVIQSDLAVSQHGSTHTVPQHVSGKYSAASPHKCDFWHSLSFRPSPRPPSFPEDVFICFHCKGFRKSLIGILFQKIA